MADGHPGGPTRADLADLLDRYELEEDREELAEVAKQLLRLGAESATEGRWEEALAIFVEIPTRIAGATEPELRRIVLPVYSNIAECLERLGRFDEAGRAKQTLFSYREEALTFYEKTAAAAEQNLPAQRRLLARALVGKGIALGGLMRRDAALAAMQDVVDRFGDAPDDELQRSVSAARAAIDELNNL